MNLEEYFTKSFKTMFKPKPYLASLVIFVILGILAMIVGAIFMIGAFDQLALLMGQMGTTMDTSVLWALFLSLGLPFIGFCIILTYLYDVGVAFLFRKIEAELERKKGDFFDNFGKAFYDGLMLFIGQIILYIALAILGAILWAISLIPVVGWIIAIILGIIVMLLFISAGFALLGFTLRNGLKKGLMKAFTLPFNLRITGTVILAFIVALVMSLILGVLSMIPILGWILYVLGIPLIVIFHTTIAYCVAKE